MLVSNWRYRAVSVLQTAALYPEPGKSDSITCDSGDLTTGRAFGLLCFEPADV